MPCLCLLGKEREGSKHCARGSGGARAMSPALSKGQKYRMMRKCAVHVGKQHSKQVLGGLRAAVFKELRSDVVDEKRK